MRRAARVPIRVWRGRTRQLQAQRRQYLRIARLRAHFAAGYLLHGVDQHRQPSAFAIAGSPSPDLLSHCDFPFGSFLGCFPSANPADTNSGARNLFRRPYRKRKSGRCDLLHRELGPPALNPPNDAEITATFVRSSPRPPHRLCADCHRRWGCCDRADLSPADLILAWRLRLCAAYRPFGYECPRPAKGSGREPTFALPVIPAKAR
jgi:hypothetical protein